MELQVINGVPAHVLFVHVVVVLVPVTALCLLACAIWPPLMRWFGLVLPAMAFVALGSVPVTTEAGEWLEHRVQESALLERHTELGDGLLPWVAGLFLVAVGVWWFYRKAGESVGLPIRAAAIVLSLAVAVGAGVQVYRVGDSGAKAAWKDRYSSAPADHAPGDGDGD